MRIWSEVFFNSFYKPIEIDVAHSEYDHAVGAVVATDKGLYAFGIEGFEALFGAEYIASDWVVRE